ncbi:HSF-type DNA-binding-domain-containing protein [Peziza echinospora]|nr:HSF-type DNA-binding-domain-containing protein [Peziza echinospora]
MSLSANADVNMGGTAPSSGPGGLGAGAGIQQPKVQTAFIHKLYNMLEDVNIQHLISWSSTNESFVVSPTSEFSKVLSQYFKHTNVSSFVRQLNMYGFHKVNDVFHNGSPDAALWEFKHGNGNFKRGDLVGLREIKRRASRHALIHRDSFSGSKGGATSSPGTPGDQSGDSIEARLLGLEHSLYDLGNRLARSEEHNSILSHRCQSYLEGLTRCHQWTIDLSQFVTHLCPRDAPIIREIQSMQKEIERHTRLMEEPQDLHMRDRPIFSSTVESAPLSPRQRPVDEEQRPQFLSATRPGGLFRPPPPPHMSSLPTRRYGSFSGGPPSPTSHRPQPHQPPQPPQPLPAFQSPPSHLSRRHTSADIRLHGWRPENSPFHPSNNSGSQWPQSPRGSISHDNTRETLAAYEINKRPTSGYGPTTPPPPPSVGGGISENGWTFANAKYPSRSNAPDPGPSVPPAPPTRRSSMASSSVHALLNPSSETNGDDCDPMEDRKRKRLA